MTPNEKELSRFRNIELNNDQLNAMNAFRIFFSELAAKTLSFCPASADRSAAIRYLRLAHMQINAAISHDWENKE
jgi:hypothetical protein